LLVSLLQEIFQISDEEKFASVYVNSAKCVQSRIRDRMVTG